MGVLEETSESLLYETGRMMNEWGVPTVYLESLLYQFISRLREKGAYSLLLLNKDELIAARNPRGFRPLVLGVSELAEELRRKLEIVRHRPRHGSKRTLSVLSLALMAVTDTFLLNRLNLIKVLVDCLGKLGENQIFVSPLLG